MKRYQFKSNFLQISISSNLRGENDKFLNSRKFKLYVAKLQSILEKILLKDNTASLFLKKRGVVGTEVAATLCGHKRIRRLNKEFRAKDKKTDVLSFQLHDSLRRDDFKIISPQLELGDIFICYDVALAQSRRFNISVEDEFLHLFVHGFLHLLGFDHEQSKEEEKVMNDLENKVLTQLSRNK